MTYTNLSDLLIDNPHQYITMHWINSNETSFVKKHMLARGVYLGLTPASIITGVIDTFAGIGFGMTSIFTLGKQPEPYLKTFSHLNSTRKFLSRP